MASWHGHFSRTYRSVTAGLLRGDGWRGGSRTVPCAEEFSSAAGPSSLWACGSRGEAVRGASTPQFLPVSCWQWSHPPAHAPAPQPARRRCCSAEASACSCRSLHPRVQHPGQRVFSAVPPAPLRGGQCRGPLHTPFSCPSFGGLWRSFMPCRAPLPVARQVISRAYGRVLWAEAQAPVI